MIGNLDLLTLVTKLYKEYKEYKEYSLIAQMKNELKQLGIVL